jgi:hypothetical protein
MNKRRLGIAIGAIAALVAMVAWIGELDLGLEDAVESAPPAAATDSNPPRSNPSFSKP